VQQDGTEVCECNIVAQKMYDVQCECLTHYMTAGSRTLKASGWYISDAIITDNNLVQHVCN